VLLTDFGLSAWLAEAEAGEAAGTAPYMAPESFQGQGGMAADVYGLAATLFHLVTGEPHKDRRESRRGGYRDLDRMRRMSGYHSPLQWGWGIELRVGSR
jgi:serine/threonine protein kinase